jgi:hypothetical protein
MILPKYLTLHNIKTIHFTYKNKKQWIKYGLDKNNNTFIYQYNWSPIRFNATKSKMNIILDKIIKGFTELGSDQFERNYLM